MSDLNVYIRRLESNGESDLGLWRQINNTFHGCGWITDGRYALNVELINKVAEGDAPELLMVVALSFVPKNWGWLVEVWQREESWAQVVQRSERSTRPSGIFSGAEAKSPACALCLAVLRARSVSVGK